MLPLLALAGLLWPVAAGAQRTASPVPTRETTPPPLRPRQLRALMIRGHHGQMIPVSQINGLFYRGTSGHWLVELQRPVRPEPAVVAIELHPGKSGAPAVRRLVRRSADRSPVGDGLVSWFIAPQEIWVPVPREYPEEVEPDYVLVRHHRNAHRTPDDSDLSFLARLLGHSVH